jgi:hypothetical protein
MTDWEQDPRAPFGALVGWDHLDMGERVMVKLQSTRSRDDLDEAELDEFRYFMTKNQAAVLANYLFGISDRLPPPSRKRRWSFGKARG